MYVYCGNDPIDEDTLIPIEECKSQEIAIKCRQPVFTDISPPVHLTRTSSGTTQEKKQARRTKERKIGFIVDKVRQWRSKYNGETQTDGQILKMNLEEAAKEVGISKKSLDDYLLQIRFGKKYGFNFQDHRDHKVGILRAYVKKHKKFEKTLQNASSKEQRQIIEQVRSEPGTPQCKGINCCEPSYLEEMSK